MTIPHADGEAGAAGPVLVVVPCGRSKIWDHIPDTGAVPASDAYTGGPFRLNRAYAERFGSAWVVLSARYGFVRPESEIPGPYEVTFNRSATNPIAVDALRRQVRELGLDCFPLIIVLGGRRYREVVAEAFAGLPTRLVAPFAGLGIGKAMQATKSAIASGHSGIRAEEVADARPR